MRRPITFTLSGANPAAGIWRSLYFESGTEPSASHIRYASVLYGGSTDGADLRMNGSSPQFDHVEGDLQQLRPPFVAAR